MEKESDYVFHYPIDEKEAARHDPLLEMIRLQLEALLNLLFLYHQGEKVEVDGFRLLNEAEVIHPIFQPETGSMKSESRPAREQAPKNSDNSSYQSLRNAELYEPRIPHLKRVLESILSVVDLESNGKPVKIDGFRLKDLNHWLVPSAGDPAEIFDHLASRCDCHCSFCYLDGNPPSLALQQPGRTAQEEYSEGRTRLKYFSPKAQRALFPTLGSPYEALSHPHALDLLADLRKKTDRPFRISTNGNSLTGDRIQKLSSLKPIYLYLSLNSSSIDRRTFLMGGKDPAVAIRSLPLLNENRIPYAVVIVPWPFPSKEEMLTDLTATVAYADTHDAHLVEVSLPGYSQYFSGSPLFDLGEVWPPIVSQIRCLRREIRCPLLVKPSLYEETLDETVYNQPVIVGVVKNSPAASAGLQPGDRIQSIGGLKISSRPQARDLLRLHHQCGSLSVPVSVQRDGPFIDFQIFSDRFDYPYTPETDHHLGIIFRGEGFRPSILEDLKSLIWAQEARRVLLLSSLLVKPVFEQILQESPIGGDIQIHVLVPENRFWGGNIFMGDLLVVQDFISAIQEYLEKNPPPDLIIIPSSPFALGDWKRDLEGRVYTDIQRAVHIPVALLDFEPIYD